jgi:hypothetical protein
MDFVFTRFEPLQWKFTCGAGRVINRIVAFSFVTGEPMQVLFAGNVEG